MSPSLITQLPFVWSLLNHQGREHLQDIVKRKEAERWTGNSAWIAIGTPLGENLLTTARQLGGTMQVVFCAALHPSEVSDDPHYLWSWWEDRDGCRYDIPDHVLVVGPLGDNPYEYALVCTSEEMPFSLQPQQFCLGHYHNYPSGRQIGVTQRAAVVSKRSPENVCGGRTYKEGFIATLINPWQVKVIPDRPLSPVELHQILNWERHGTYPQWQALVDSIRRPAMNASNPSANGVRSIP
jgi:hypothetical protein